MLLSWCISSVIYDSYAITTYHCETSLSTLSWEGTCGWSYDSESDSGKISYCWTEAIDWFTDARDSWDACWAFAQSQQSGPANQWGQTGLFRGGGGFVKGGMGSWVFEQYYNIRYTLHIKVCQHILIVPQKEMINHKINDPFINIF